MKKNKITTILFDLDGTLIATERVFFEAIRDTLNTEYSLSFSLQDYRKDFLVGEDQFADYLAKNGVIQKTEDELWNKIRSVYDVRLNQALIDRSILHSFKEVESFRKAGYKVALVTSNERARCLAILTAYNAQTYFEQIITRDDVASFKPNPECYMLALEKMKVGPEDCLAIEDTIMGFRAAKDAGIDCVFVMEHTQTDKKDLLDLGADVFDTVDQVRDSLLAQS